jgi:hypothetical protein
MEKYFWSLDVSTTNIGCSLWNLKGKLIELKHLELKIDKKIAIVDREIHKAEIFRKYVLEYKERVLNELNGEIINIIIEEPLGGSNNPNTASLLFGFNGICRYILFSIFNLYPIKISVYDSRKIFCDELVKISFVKGEKKETLSFPENYRDRKKIYIWEKVARLEQNIEWFYDKNGKLKDINYDLSDSYCVGYAGLKQLGIIK